MVNEAEKVAHEENQPSCVTIQSQEKVASVAVESTKIDAPNAGKVPKIPKKKVKSNAQVDEQSKSGVRTSSEIWDHFTKSSGSNGVRAACNYCGKSYASESKVHGTSSLWSHLLYRCLKYPYKIPDKKQKTLVFNSKKEGLEGDSPATLKAVTFSVEECRLALAKMIITDELTFRFVEGEGFKNFVQVLQPKFTVPCRTTVARDCLKLYYEEKEMLKKVIKSQCICLTTDTWTSVQQLNYMCLTAYWIDDDWKLNKRILNFCLIPNHKGETIGKMIESCLSQWGIDRIFTITVDNASSNDGAIRHLKRITMDWKDTILDHEFIHMRCCAHILNLIVREGMDEIHESISKIRNAVRYVRSSLARLQQFKKCVDKVKIETKSLVCLDIKTRWNSTFLMLETAEKFQKAFKRLEYDDQKFLKHLKEGGAPNDNDWDNARVFVKFLKLFYNATLNLSGSLFVTSNAFFHELIPLRSRISQLCKNGDTLLSSMAERMQAKFDKYWENVDNINFLLYVAILLDPRYKLAFVNFGFNQIYDCEKAKEMTERVKDTLVRLYEHYMSNSPSIESATQFEDQSVNMMDLDENDVQQLMELQFDKHMEEVQSAGSNSEVDKYLLEACEGRGNSKFDILGWWKHNSSRYQILSQVARDVLAISVSTVTSESAFSTGGRILDPFRSSLSPKMVEALICTQNWLRSYQKPIDLREATDDIEKYEEIATEHSQPGSGSSQCISIID